MIKEETTIMIGNDSVMPLCFLLALISIAESDAVRATDFPAYVQRMEKKVKGKNTMLKEEYEV